MVGGDKFTHIRIIYLLIKLTENSVVKGLGDMLLKFRFSSCSRKRFAEFFK